jgi:hypothetical protein
MRWRSHAREFSDPLGRAAATCGPHGDLFRGSVRYHSPAMLFQGICHAWFKRDFIINYQADLDLFAARTRLGAACHTEPTS